MEGVFKRNSIINSLIAKSFVAKLNISSKIRQKIAFWLCNIKIKIIQLSDFHMENPSLIQ